MYKLTKKELGKRLTAIGLVLTLGVPLVGCAEKAECEIPESHVHLYVKELEDGTNIETYRQSEHVEWKGYQRYDDYITITKEDEKIYKALKGRFEGQSNWDYLYNQMASKPDFLEFYYRYTTTQVYTTRVNGKTQVRTRTVTHSGWTDNPNRAHNNGDVRICHYKYYAYKLVYNNGKYKLEKSPLVDDIREIIFEYPYFDEECWEIDYEEFEFDKDKLDTLTPDNEHNKFNHPDLENKDLYPIYSRDRTK